MLMTEPRPARGFVVSAARHPASHDTPDFCPVTAVARLCATLPPVNHLTPAQRPLRASATHRRGGPSPIPPIGARDDAADRQPRHQPCSRAAATVFMACAQGASASRFFKKALAPKGHWLQDIQIRNRLTQPQPEVSPLRNPDPRNIYSGGAHPQDVLSPKPARAGESAMRHCIYKGFLSGAPLALRHCATVRQYVMSSGALHPNMSCAGRFVTCSPLRFFRCVGE